MNEEMTLESLARNIRALKITQLDFPSFADLFSHQLAINAHLSEALLALLENNTHEAVAAMRAVIDNQKSSRELFSELVGERKTKLDGLLSELTGGGDEQG